MTGTNAPLQPREALSALVAWCDKNDWGAVPEKLEAACRNALLSEIGPSMDREALRKIYGLLRGIPEAMESMVAPSMDGGRMAYWTASVRDALRLATVPEAPSPKGSENG